MFVLEDDYDLDEDDEYVGYLYVGDGQRECLLLFIFDDVFKFDVFYGDVVNGLVDVFWGDDNVDFDLVKLEFMGFRLVNNVLDSFMCCVIVVVFIKCVVEMLILEYGGLELVKVVERVFKDKNGVVKFIKDVGVGGDDVKQ